MSYRRRRGLGGSRRSWLDRLLGWGEDASASGDSGEEGGEAGSGRSGDGPGAPEGGRRGDGGGGWPWDGGSGPDGRRVGVVLLCLAMLFGVGYLAAAEWLFPASSAAESSQLVEVPELVGLTDEEAREVLGTADLEYRLGSEVPHRRAPEGAVLAQSPLPGQFARPGAPVSVTVSLGPDRRVVPDLRGLSDRQGVIVLERLGFGTSRDNANSAVERGRVVGTRPESGTELTLPAEVTVVVSRGPDVVEVPDLVGVHVDDVESRLEAAGLVLGEVQYDPEARAAPGRVVGQAPAPDFALRGGARVSVRVAGSAPEPEETEEAGDGEEAAPDTAEARGGMTGRGPERAAGSLSPASSDGAPSVTVPPSHPEGG